MQSVTFEAPDELLTLLQQSSPVQRPAPTEVRIALAAFLFHRNVVSVGKAAQLSGESRAVFEQILVDMGIPVVCYGDDDYERDLEGLARAKPQIGTA